MTVLCAYHNQWSSYCHYYNDNATQCKKTRVIFNVERFSCQESSHTITETRDNLFSRKHLTGTEEIDQSLLRLALGMCSISCWSTPLKPASQGLHQRNLTLINSSNEVSRAHTIKLSITCSALFSYWVHLNNMQFSRRSSWKSWKTENERNNANANPVSAKVLRSCSPLTFRLD